MARFFIDRPIFAWVIALFILMMGSVSVRLLPVAQYPTVAPPSISVSAFYPGASAQSLDDSVISVIEQEMNGSPGLIYMESVAQANGSGQITLTFETGTDPALAQVDVQNRLEPRRASPARGRHAAGRARRQGAQQLPAVHDSVDHRWLVRPGGAGRLRVAQHRCRDPAHSGRRPGAAVRHRACDAHLDRPAQAGGLSACGRQ